MVTQPHGIRARLLLVVAVAATGVAWIGLELWTLAGRSLPAVSWAALPILLAVSIGLYLAGRPVQKLVAGTATKPVHPLYAARVLALAQAAALTGAVIVGWYVAQILQLLPDLDIASQQQAVLELALLGLASMLLAGVGLLVQRMCRIDRPQGRSGHDADGDTPD
ncbi:MAG: DUF3180 domain-containing protein [Lapillicoccus sp.]